MIFINYKPCVFSSFDDSTKPQNVIKFKLAFYRPLSVVFKDITIGMGGFATVATFFFSEFEIVLHRRRDGLRH